MVETSLKQGRPQYKHDQLISFVPAEYGGEITPSTLARSNGRVTNRGKKNVSDERR